MASFRSPVNEHRSSPLPRDERQEPVQRVKALGRLRTAEGSTALIDSANMREGVATHLTEAGHQIRDLTTRVQANAPGARVEDEPTPPYRILVGDRQTDEVWEVRQMEERAAESPPSAKSDRTQLPTRSDPVHGPPKVATQLDSLLIGPPGARELRQRQTSRLPPVERQPHHRGIGRTRGPFELDAQRWDRPQADLHSIEVESALASRQTSSGCHEFDGGINEAESERTLQRVRRLPHFASRIALHKPVLLNLEFTRDRGADYRLPVLCQSQQLSFHAFG